MSSSFSRDGLPEAPAPSLSANDQNKILESIGDGVLVTDTEDKVTFLNPVAERLTGWTREAALGQNFSLVFSLVMESATAPKRLRCKDGSEIVVDVTETLIRHEAGTPSGKVMVFRDTTQETERTQRLAKSEEQYRTLFEAIDVGFCIIQMIFDEKGQPQDYRFFEGNSAFERHTGLVNTYGKTARELVPDLDEFWFRTYGDVALTGQSIRFENHAPAMSRWFDVYALRIGPAEDYKVGILFTNVTASKAAQEALQQYEERLRDNEQRERDRLTNIFMQAPAFMATLRGPEHIFDLANPPYFQLVGHRDIIGKPAHIALPEIAEQGFIDLLDRVYQTGEPFIGRDVRILLQAKPTDSPEEHFLDFTYLPLLEADGTLSGVLAHGIDLTERKKLELEREQLLNEQQRLLAEAQARAEREALVNAVGTAINTAPSDPDAILQVALTTLGQGLAVDRCYYVHYDQAKDSARIGQEWHRAGLNPIMGYTFKMSAYAVDRDTQYRAGNIHIISDTATLAPEDANVMYSLGVGALIRVPLQIGNEMTALGVTSRQPRSWTTDEVQILQAVAAQLQPALNVAQLQQRERNIAAQLQDALIPPTPQSLPGMKLASFYRPALQEANVGGDFFDVFDISDGQIALIVADLSGKGLHAASEVATCRNMVRYALYTTQQSQIGDAVTSLNTLFFERQLLSGFATAFIGVYDPATQSLTYVNCGQEPGLIWRASTGTIDELSPTGPVLGGFGGGIFDQATVTLFPEDVLALFTDGLTEVGPSRRELLEIEGVCRLLQECCSFPDHERDPQQIVGQLINGIDTFGRGGTGDDIALLIGAVSSIKK